MVKDTVANVEVRYGKSGIRYRIRWHDGTTRRSRTFDTMQEAQVFQAEMNVAQLRGRTPVSAMTIGDILDEHIRRSRGEVKPSTLRLWKQHRRDHVPASILKKRADEMRTPDWQRWVDSITAKGLAPNTVAGIVATVSGALTAAARIGWVERNTLRGVRYPSPRPRDIRVWSAEQARQALAATSGDPMWHALYWLALSTGIRPGEARVLTWDDLNMQTGTLFVHRTESKDEDGTPIVREGTKRGHGRYIQLPRETLDALLRLKAEGKGPYIFGGHKPLYRNTWWQYHKRMCERAGLEFITLHQMRHSYATLQLGQNVSPKVVGSVLGHKTTATTLDLYSHVVREMQDAAADVAGRVLSGVAHNNNDAADDD